MINGGSLWQASNDLLTPSFIACAEACFLSGMSLYKPAHGPAREKERKEAEKQWRSHNA